MGSLALGARKCRARTIWLTGELSHEIPTKLSIASCESLLWMHTCGEVARFACLDLGDFCTFSSLAILRPDSDSTRKILQNHAKTSSFRCNQPELRCIY